VHAGHRSILAQLHRLKRLHSGESVLITFDPHPQLVFRNNPNFGILTTLEEKLALLEQVHLDHCVILPFTSEFSQLSGEEYIETILYKGTRAHTVVIGYDHNYGKHASGDFALMQRMGEHYHFAVEKIAAFDVHETHVSSTKIRNALREGNVDSAKEFLTYAYSLAGTVVQGKQIGRTLGFPTANIAPDSDLKIIPATGVYAAWCEIDNKKHPTVVNIGTNPTIAQGLAQTIEAHILDFSGDVYGKSARLYFEKRLRSQETFSSLEELKTAIGRDCAQARTFFGETACKL
jgi:riboflavin kinase/FMN adenylyltransferase